MLLLIFQITISMLVPIALCMYIGYRIGLKPGAPCPAVLGLFIGAIAGFQSVYRLVKKYLRQQDRREK